MIFKIKKFIYEINLGLLLLVLHISPSDYIIWIDEFGYDCKYHKFNGSNVLYLILYVDNILLINNKLSFD